MDQTNFVSVSKTTLVSHSCLWRCFRNKSRGSRLLYESVLPVMLTAVSLVRCFTSGLSSDGSHVLMMHRRLHTKSWLLDVRKVRWACIAVNKKEDLRSLDARQQVTAHQHHQPELGINRFTLFCLSFRSFFLRNYSRDKKEKNSNKNMLIIRVHWCCSSTLQRNIFFLSITSFNLPSGCCPVTVSTKGVIRKNQGPSAEWLADSLTDWRMREHDTSSQ